jgi:hypothetical protein
MVRARRMRETGKADASPGAEVSPRRAPCEVAVSREGGYGQ